MLSWDTFKRAAIEYSRLHPVSKAAELTPVVNTKQQSAPIDCIGVLAVDWGQQTTVAEVMASTATTQAWAYDTNSIWLTPAPTTTDAIAVYYYARHLPDDSAEEFPTIPAHHIPLVEDLEMAKQLEDEAAEIESGPVRYTMGQSEVDRTSAATGKRAQADALRRRVHDILDEPLVLWG